MLGEKVLSEEPVVKLKRFFRSWARQSSGVSPIHIPKSWRLRLPLGQKQKPSVQGDARWALLFIRSVRENVSVAKILEKLDLASFKCVVSRDDL